MSNWGGIPVACGDAIAMTFCRARPRCGRLLNVVHNRDPRVAVRDSEAAFDLRRFLARASGRWRG